MFHCPIKVGLKSLWKCIKVMNEKDIGCNRDMLEERMRSSRAVTTEGDKGAESHAQRWKIWFHCPVEA